MRCQICDYDPLSESNYRDPLFPRERTVHYLENNVNLCTRCYELSQNTLVRSTLNGRELTTTLLDPEIDDE
jgi:hypothetical protein